MPNSKNSLIKILVNIVCVITLVKSPKNYVFLNSKKV